MCTGGNKVVTCRDAAGEILNWWFVLATEDRSLCLLKLYDESAHDTPEEKMRLNKLLWEAPRRAAGWRRRPVGDED
jgi:hypothetical protein